MMRRLAALVSTLLLATATFAEVNAPDASAGRTTFEAFCVGQFKFDADGDGHTGTDDDLFLVIRNGAGPAGGNPLMAAWGHLGDEQVRVLVAYVRSLEGAKAD